MVHKNLPVPDIITNCNIIFMETDHGNHLGYVEGGLLESISHRNTNYSYPTKLALIFFNEILKKKS